MYEGSDGEGASTSTQMTAVVPGASTPRPEKCLKYNGTPDYVSAHVMFGGQPTRIDDVFAMVTNRQNRKIE